MKLVLFYVVFGIALLFGLSSVVWPAKVVALRQRLTLSNGLLSGGYFYATVGRARMTGVVVALIASVALISRLY